MTMRTTINRLTINLPSKIFIWGDNASLAIGFAKSGNANPAMLMPVSQLTSQLTNFGSVAQRDMTDYQPVLQKSLYNWAKSILLLQTTNKRFVTQTQKLLQGNAMLPLEIKYLQNAQYEPTHSAMLARVIAYRAKNLPAASRRRLALMSYGL